MTGRPPPALLAAEVASREWLTPRLARVALHGSALERLEVTQPASSVRVLLPDPDAPGRLVTPAWDGNRFVLPGGGRPAMRTLTPRLHDRDGGRLWLDVVVHGAGLASRWASTAPIGSPLAVSGPARGYDLDPAATSLILGGDATALAAISQILEATPGSLEVTVYAETEPASPLPGHSRLRVHWIEPDRRRPGRALVDVLGRLDLPEGARLWAAGEAAAMQQLRRRLLQDRQVPRDQVTIRGYWKHGRAGDEP